MFGIYVLNRTVGAICGIKYTSPPVHALVNLKVAVNTTNFEGSVILTISYSYGVQVSVYRAFDNSFVELLFLLTYNTIECKWNFTLFILYNLFFCDSDSNRDSI